MTLSKIKNPNSVLKAIEEFDSIGRDSFLKKYGFLKSKIYVIEYNNKQYDSKAIIGVAHGYEFPDKGHLTPDMFSKLSGSCLCFDIFFLFNC
jgi:hypothetical protein